MKKLLSFIISAVLVIGLAVGVAFVVMHFNNNKEHKLTVTSDFYGSIQAAINDNEYTITANNSKTYNVTKQSSITLTAIPETGYAFVEWELNGATYSSELEINLTVTKDTNVKAVFSASSVDITVVDGTSFTDTFKYNVANNLLTILQNKYNAGVGYTYSYSIDETPISANTTINANTTITRTKTPIDYTVTFKLPDGYKFEGDATEKVVSYNIETISSIVNPTLPTAANGYTIAWDTYTIDETNIGNITVEAVLTKIPYTATFTLPSGFTFEDGTTTADVTYYIDSETVVCPKTVETREHYEIAWNEITFTFDEENPYIINGVEAPINYPINFKDGEEVLETIYYNIENKDNVTVPTITIEHYTVTFNLEIPEELGEVNVELTKTPIEYTVTFKDGNTEVGTATYTIENQEIDNPTYSVEHYNITWNIQIPENLGNFDVELTKTPIEYTVTFKDGNTEVGTATYTIENQTVTAPDYSVDHYDITWNIQVPAELGNFDVVATKTPTEYTVTYKLPAGYTFDGTKTQIEVVYTIETVSTISAPVISEVANTTLAWPTEITPENLGTISEITAIAYNKITINEELGDSVDAGDPYIYNEIYTLSSDADNVYRKSGSKMIVDCTKDEFAERLFNNYTYTDDDGETELCVSVNGVKVTSAEEFKTEFFKDGVTSVTISYSIEPVE